jgi:hypothetical protein
MPAKFLQALIDSGRFFRNARSQILFLIAEPPAQFMPVIRKEELRGILESGELLQLTGDSLTADDFFGLWTWVYDRRWKLPHAGERHAVPVRK